MRAPNVWAEPRNLFFFRTGRLTGDEGETICEIVALAETGAVLRLPSPPAVGDWRALEINSAHRLTGRVAWADEQHCGLEFIDREAVRAILSRRETSFPYRPPRLRLGATLELRLGAQRLKVRCHDISESGIKVELPDDRSGSEAAVAVDGLGTMDGRICWWRDGKAGIAFQQPIPSANFTRWVTARLESRAG